MNAAMKQNPASVCPVCAIPLDAQYFDESRIVDLEKETDALRSGRAETLAKFELPPEYCGVLQYFFQFTNTHAKDPSMAVTPDFEWSIRANGHPLHPYLGFRHIINPWGCPSCSLALRLDEGSRLEFVVRRVASTDPEVTQIGARLVGRYWYNAVYGNGT